LSRSGLVSRTGHRDTPPRHATGTCAAPQVTGPGEVTVDDQPSRVIADAASAALSPLDLVRKGPDQDLAR
jgi:hypothetical protein